MANTPTLNRLSVGFFNILPKSGSGPESVIPLRMFSTMNGIEAEIICQLDHSLQTFFDVIVPVTRMQAGRLQIGDQMLVRYVLTDGLNGTTLLDWIALSEYAHVMSVMKIIFVTSVFTHSCHVRVLS